MPPDRPFLDSLTCLTFLAACTSRVELGISVLVLPYRQPLVWGKIAATLDHLSKGRFILGVGVGWMEEEFRALQAPFQDRGRRTDEQLEVLKEVWSTEHSSFSGEFYEFEDIAFLPKPRVPGASRSGSAAKGAGPSGAPGATATRGSPTSCVFAPTSSPRDSTTPGATRTRPGDRRTACA